MAVLSLGAMEERSDAAVRLAAAAWNTRRSLKRQGILSS